jgi:hypothetical protein
MLNNRIIIFNSIILLRGGAAVPPWYGELIFDFLTKTSVIIESGCLD